MTRRVLVTGSSGFIGRHLRAELEGRGRVVVPLSRGPEPGTYPVPDDAADVEAVVHLAFPTDHGQRAAEPLAALTEAVAGTASVARLTAAVGAPHLVIASSGKVYGRPASVPTPESADTAPDNDLGRLKDLTERVATAGARAAGFGVTCLRLFNVYGPAQSPHFVVPKLVRAALNGEEVALGEMEHRRDFVYVGDAVRAFIRAIERPPGAGEARPLNVGSGRSASVRQLVALVEAAAGAPIRWRAHADLLRPDEPVEERADASALGALGWTPTTTLEAGLAATVRRSASGL